MTAFGGFRDGEVPKAKLEPWSEVSRWPFRLHMVPGDHFFVSGSGRPHLLRLIGDTLVRPPER